MTRAAVKPTNDEGYLLLGLVVVCFLLLLALAIAAPRVAKQLERDREVESEHRAQEYVRAIQLYYRRTGRLPNSIDQLLGSGSSSRLSTIANVRYLRQQYKDPLTGDDYRLIHVGEAKTEVKGFFGEPLAGMPTGNLGSAAGMQSGIGLGGNSSQSSGSIGGSSGLSLGNSGTTFSSPSASSASSGPAGTAAASGSAATTGTGSTGSANSGSPSSGLDATTFQGSKAAFLGVGSNAKGHGSVEWNGSENIEDWEFLYDPRVELLKAKVSLFGGSPAASGSGSLGGMQGAGSSSIFGNGAATNGSGATTGTQPGAGSTSIFAPSTNSTGATGSTASDPNTTTPR